jgi:hypothetical protein
MAAPPPPGRPPETSLLAIVSLVAGILGVIGSFFAPLLASIVAIVCGHLARGRIRREPARLTGDGIALVGLILGYIGIAISIVGLIFWGAVFGLGLRFMYEIFQQIESDTGGQLTESFRLLQSVA